MIVAIAALLLQLQPSPVAPAAPELAPTAISATISTPFSGTSSASSSEPSSTTPAMSLPETADANDSAVIHWNLKSVTFDATFDATSSTADKDKSASNGPNAASLKNVSLTDAQKQGISTVRVPDPEPTKPIQMPSAETLHPSRAWLALSFVQSSAATFDAYSTRQAIGHGAVESDPLMRPFAHSGAIYGAIQVGPAILDYVARHMQRSQTNFFRRTWWVPQSLATAGFLFSGVHNMGVASSLQH